MPLLGLFIVFVLVCLAIWAVQRLVVAFEVPTPIAQLLLVVVVVIGVVYILGSLAGWYPPVRLR